MARTARIKRNGIGTAHYHVTSRTNDQRFLFEKGAVRDALVAALKRAAAFCGVRIEAYVAMSNHFHIVCEVCRPAEKIPETEVLRRIEALKGRKAAEEIAVHWQDLHALNAKSLLEGELDAWRNRMNDISQFVKTFKELFNICFKRGQGYSGSIWNGRFKSTLVEDGEYLARCIRYVELNPVRAGMVGQMKDYRWSSHNENAAMESDAGSVPGELMVRVVQIGSGKVFGGLRFVAEAVFAFGDRFRSRSVVPRRVGEIGFATHGHLLAKKVAR